MRPSEAEGELASLGRLVVVVLAVVLGLWLVLLGVSHRAPGGPVQLSRAQYCGPVPSYAPGVKHGPRPAGC